MSNSLPTKISDSQLLCDVCNKMLQQGLGAVPLANEKGMREVDTTAQATFHTLRTHFRQAAIDGCWVCEKLQAQLNSLGEKDLPDTAIFHGPASVSYCEFALKTIGGRGLEFLIYPKVREWTAEDDLLLSTSMCKSTADDVVMQWAALKLTTCLNANRKSGRVRSKVQYYPTRVLDVSNDHIRLIETKDLNLEGHYATLSHCWGTEDFFVLSPETQHQMQKGFPVNELLPTFRDACMLLRKLQIRWLWIDCYCILQGSSLEAVRDWDQESGQMAEIYANAVMNIMACHASNPHVGLFASRKPSQSTCLLLKAYTIDNTRKESEIAYEIYQRSGYGARSWLSEVGDFTGSPLLRRRWVLQECIVARRLLSFNAHNVTWQCGTKFASISDVPTFVSNSIEHTHPFYALKYEEYYRDDPSHYRRAGLWFKVILRSYCSGKLTYPEKDILKAMEGIGSFAARICNDKYHLGMLKSTIPRALLWQTYPTSSSSPSRAPSWHWARYDGVLDHDHPVELSKHRTWFTRHYTQPLIYFSLSNDLSVFAHDQSTSTWPVALCIGRLLSIPSKFWQASRVPWSDKRHLEAVQLDSPGEELRDDDMILPLVESSVIGRLAVSGLLVRLTGILRYERVGCFIDVKLCGFTEVKPSFFYLA